MELQSPDSMRTVVKSHKGFTLIELLIALGLAGILAATAIPVFVQSSARNNVWTASETIGAQIRQARLKAVSRNKAFQVRFNCPAAGQFRTLLVDTTTPIDDADRCGQTFPLDSGIFAMPNSVSYGDANPLEVDGFGKYTSPGGIPQTITVTNGESSRSLTVSATGQVTFETY
jgi:prepilin-type N-terminal cleavage/methylation domain-containing protein